MGKYKYLLKNIGLLTLSSFATKLLSFFLVPLYTNVLTTTEYGIYDLFTTTIGVLVPILTFNIQDSVMRFALDKKYNREALTVVSIQYLILSCTIVLLALIANCIFGFSLIGKKYAIFFFLMFFTQALSGIILSYIRGIDKIAELSISSVVASIITIGCNILFLLVFDMKLIGYFLANIIGPLAQCGYLIGRSRMLSNIRPFQEYPKEKKEMSEYSKPMIANSIAWWINNASDRYVVILFCGLSENGIYSVASKIPSILNIIQSIFSQAWTLSAVKEYDPEDKSHFFENVYKFYNCVMVLSCSAIILSDKLLARFLYARDFYDAWRYVPWLTIAIVFGSLSGYIGGFFSAVKDSKIFAQSTAVGAISNILLNFLMTPFIGPLGAAISTAICYFIVWVIRYRHSKKFVKLRIQLKRDVASYILLAIQAIILLLMDGILMYCLQICLFIIAVWFYRNDLKLVIEKGKQKILK